jgi:transposase
MREGGREAVRADDEVVPAAELHRLEERVRDLERLLGRKTMEVEILKEALELARAKKPILLSSSAPLDGSDEDGHRHAGARPLEHRRACQGRMPEAWAANR